MADILHKEFTDADIELVEGDKGIFDVAVDNKVVYSKDKRGISLSDVDDEDVVTAIILSDDGSEK